MQMIEAKHFWVVALMQFVCIAYLFVRILLAVSKNNKGK
jgi:hypothetical protein